MSDETPRANDDIDCDDPIWHDSMTCQFQRLHEAGAELCWAIVDALHLRRFVRWLSGREDGTP